jgi:hypothetical protein
MSDQLVAETSTWQHTTLTTDKYPCPRWDSNLRSQQVSGLRPLTCWDLYRSLQEKMANKLICVGCCARNVHNTVQSASGCLPVDTHALTGKKLPALSHLCHTRWSLEVCEFTETEYKAILGHCKSRWLSLLSAVERPMDVSFYLASLLLLCWIVHCYSEEFS